MPRKKSLEPNSVGTAVAEPEDSSETSPTPAPAPTTTKRMMLTSADYKGMSIWQALEKMTEDDWSDKMLYVLRIAPLTVNSSTGEKYGCQLKGYFPKFSKTDLQSMLGGGRFKLWLNSTAGDNLKMGVEEVPGEPKFLSDEVSKSRSEEKPAAVAAPAPGMDLNGVKDLIRMFLESQRQEREAVGDDEGASAINKSIELMSQASLKANQLVADASRAPTLADQLAMVKQLMEIAAPKQDDMTKLLLKTLIERTLPVPGAPAANPVDQMKAAFETMKSAKELFGEAEAAASGDWKSALVAAIVPAVPQLIQLIRAAAANRPPQVIVMQPGPDGRLHAVPQHATPPTLDTVPIEPGSVGVPPASGQDARAPEPPPATPPSPPAGADLLTGDALKLRVVTMFLKGKDGSLVASFIEDAAPTVYKHLSQIDPALFPGFLKADTILAEIATEENFDEWCKEFLDYMHETEEEGAPARVPEPQAAPVQ